MSNSSIRHINSGQSGPGKMAKMGYSTFPKSPRLEKVFNAQKVSSKYNHTKMKNNKRLLDLRRSSEEIL